MNPSIGNYFICSKVQRRDEDLVCYKKSSRYWYLHSGARDKMNFLTGGWQHLFAKHHPRDWQFSVSIGEASSEITSHYSREWGFLKAMTSRWLFLFLIFLFSICQCPEGSLENGNIALNFYDLSLSCKRKCLFILELEQLKNFSLVYLMVAEKLWTLGYHSNQTSHLSLEQSENHSNSLQI